MLVTQPYPHPYNTVFQNPESLRKEKFPVAVFPGLTLYKSDRKRQPTVDGTCSTLDIYYQQVDKNNLVQWLAWPGLAMAPRI